jgi:hypothetical protein
VYAAGARVTNAGKVYHCLIGGTSAGGGGPTTEALTISDNSVTWTFVGAGTGVADVDAHSVEKGTIVGASRDISVIEQPYGGWSAVTNLLDATLGFVQQTDESLRISREEELAQPGGSVSDAIRAEILSIDGVISATVFVNNTDATDPDGLPPHSIELLVRGGDDNTIAQKLLEQVAAGIATFGTTTIAVLDSEGVSHDISFTRPTLLNIGVTVTLVKAANNPVDDTTYPLDGDVRLKDAIVSYGNAGKPGRNAVASAIGAQAFRVPGVLDVTSVLISSVASPGTPPTPVSSTTIPVSLRQLAVFDTSWINIITSNGTP